MPRTLRALGALRATRDRLEVHRLGSRGNSVGAVHSTPSMHSIKQACIRLDEVQSQPNGDDTCTGGVSHRVVRLGVSREAVPQLPMQLGLVVGVALVTVVVR